MIPGADKAIIDLLGLGPNLNDPQPKLLYHYTSAAGLLGIVETGRMRATHARYLNDSSEIEVLWQHASTRLQQILADAKSKEDKEYLAEVIGAVESRRMSNEFVASFSENADDLSQWRAYCSGEPGFSIGFLREAVSTQWVSDPQGGKSSFVGAQLNKVRYVSADCVALIDSAMDDALAIGKQFDGRKGFGGHTISKADGARAWISLLAPKYKHAAFCQECEWRLVLSKPHKPMPGQRFRPGKSKVIPYIEVELNKGTDGKIAEKYMIERVIVAPTPNPELGVEAVQGLFLAHGHPEVEVVASEVPYRDW